MKALGEKAIDGVADPGGDEEEKGGRISPDVMAQINNRHENNASQCDEIRRSTRPRLEITYIAGRHGLRTAAIPT